VCLRAARRRSHARRRALRAFPEGTDSRAPRASGSAARARRPSRRTEKASPAHALDAAAAAKSPPLSPKGTSGEGRNATEHSVPSSKSMARSAVRASVHAAAAVSPSAFPEGTRSGPYAPTLPSSPKVPARVPPHYFRCGVLALLSPRGTFAV